MSYAETYAILFNDNEFKVSAKPREIYEAINHKYAINYVLNHLDEALSEQMIKELAVRINKNISEMLKNNLAPIVILKEQRTDYFKLLELNDSISLSQFFKQLSEQEQQRIASMMPSKESLLEKLSEHNNET